MIKTVRGLAIGTGKVVHMSAVEMLGRMEAESVGAIITDPPFFIGMGLGSNEGGVGRNPWTGESTLDEMIAWSVPLAEQAARVLRPGGAMVVMGGSQSLSAMEVARDRAKLTWMSELTVLWNTGKARINKFGSLTTTIRWYCKPGSRHTFNSGAVRAIYSNILVCTKVSHKERVHPTQKPVELTNVLVSLLTREHDLVVDPFCGSGSTLVSAAMCGRRWLGCDTDIAYCRAADLRTKRLELEAANLCDIYWWTSNELKLIEG